MTPSQIFLAVLALAVFGVVLKRSTGSAKRAAHDTANGVLRIIPIFAVALPMASFLSELIPQDIAGAWLGPESGFTGILIASFAGGCIPGGPFVSFPLVLTFAKAGAGTAQMVALISGWCIYGFHRVITWEYPLLGWRFVVLRLVAALPLPIMAGLLAELIVEYLPITIGTP